MMSTRAEWWRARAGEITCDAICPSKDRAATLAVDRSHSLMLSDGLAQLCSSARHAVHTLLEHLRVARSDLEGGVGKLAPPDEFIIKQGLSMI